MGRKAIDPLFRGLDRKQRLYLGVLGEVGFPYLSLQTTWERHKVRISRGTLLAWQREPKFSDAYQTLVRQFADRMAKENLEMAHLGTDGKGKGITGGGATLRIQQLNRLVPEEYLPPIVQQIHQTHVYQVDGEFKEPRLPEVEQAEKAQPKATH